MSLELIAALLVLGACTGYLAGLLGIGGGMVLTPFLTLILSMAGVPDAVVVHAAIATSLSTILFTSLSSVRAHNSRGAVLWKVVLWLAPGILVGAALGAKISSLLPTFWISIVFAAFVGFSALKMFLNAKPKPTRQLPAAPGLFGAGTGIGAVSSLVGAGGGFISVPFMVWCNVPMHKAVGTSAALGFPIAFAGTLSYIWAGWGNPELAGTEHMLGYIKPGVREIDAALEMEVFMKSHGAGKLAFDTIFVSGAKTSLPHGVPGDKRIEAGDFVTMDFGANVDGYCTDMTRTVAVGHVSDEQKKVYDTVLKAQLACCGFAKAGYKGCEVDKVARDIIYGAGYEGCFGHGLGHAVGIEIHENPRYSPTCSDIIQSGMVMTIEPGIYLPGKFGVRIEDTTFVRPDGCEIVGKSPKELIVL